MKAKGKKMVVMRQHLRDNIVLPIDQMELSGKATMVRKGDSMRLLNRRWLALGLLLLIVLQNHSLAQEPLRQENLRVFGPPLDKTHVDPKRVSIVGRGWSAVIALF